MIETCARLQAPRPEFAPTAVGEVEHDRPGGPTRAEEGRRGRT